MPVYFQVMPRGTIIECLYDGGKLSDLIKENWRSW